jgi:hypothetical protein
MDDVCQCGRVIVQPEVGRPRKMCLVCSPTVRYQQRKAVTQLPVRPPDDGPTLVSLTKRTLDAAGVLDSWQGVAAVRVAELIDSQKHGASGASGTIKCHRESMQYALQAADSAVDADVIDWIFKDA